MTNSHSLKKLIFQQNHIFLLQDNILTPYTHYASQMVINSGVFQSPHQNHYYQIVFGEININILYAAPYTQRERNYGNANHEGISDAIENFDGETAISNVNEGTQVKLFNENLTSIFK